MIARLRSMMARWLALIVTVVTLGRVDVNASGRATTASARFKEQQAISRPVPEDSPPRQNDQNE